MSQTPSIIVVDNFYRNPMEVREFALKQNFPETGNFPGYRTHESYATDEVRNLIQSYLTPYDMEIDLWECIPGNHNGMFQYTTACDRSWIHMDSQDTTMAAIIYLTPNAPFSAGTGFYTPKDHEETNWPSGFCPKRGYKTGVPVPDGHAHGKDITKWHLVDQVGNVFNRLVMYNSHMWHTSMDYFGDCKENGRLFQIFFFKTKKEDKASNI